MAEAIIDNTRPCKSCNGKGSVFHKGFTSLEGKVYPDTTRRCFACEGTGQFAKPDFRAILSAIKGRKGLCSKRPKDRRAYYVWRMTRFHGGADVTMPVGASMEVHGDPYVAELDRLVDLVAKRVFGTDLAAAHRWGRALGIVDRDMPGLPGSAYAGGPVADGDKPLEEILELL